MVFENLSHEAVDPATHVGQEHQNICTVVVRRQRAFDGVNLPANALNASDGLVTF